MAFNYTYLANIDGWSGPSFLSTRPLVFGGNGYDPILETPNQVIVRSSDPTARSNCALSVINSKLAGVSFSDSHFADRLEGKTITVIQLDRDTNVSRVVYIGVVLFVEVSETQVSITLVEPSYSRSKQLGGKVSSELWPDARPSDVGASIGLPVGTVENARFPHVRYNKQSRLEGAILNTDTSFILDSVEGFVLGPATIGEEEVTITNIDIPTRTVTVTRTKATDHPSGEPFVLGGDFSIAIDSSGSLSTISDMKEFKSEEEVFPVRDPDNHSVVNGIRIATWLDSTPTYKEPIGDLDSIGIELDNPAASNCVNPTNALGRVGTFSERNFASIRGVGQETLQGLLDRYLRPKGRIKKVLAIVEHSGNRNNNSLGSGQLNIFSPFVPGGINAGFLTTEDQLDPDFLEIAEQKGRRSTDVPSAQSLTTAIFTPDSLVVGVGSTGTPIGGFNPEFRLANDEDITHDGNEDNSVDTISAGLGTGPFRGLRYFFGTLPSQVSPADEITQLVFRWKHGSVIEGGSAGFGNQGAISIFEGLANLTGHGQFPKSTPAVIQTATIAFAPGTKTGADLLNMNFWVDLGVALGVPNTVWTIFEANVEIQYTPSPTTAAANSGTVSSQYDITSTAFAAGVDWDDLFNTTLQVIGDTGNFFSVFRVGLIVIYEPQETRYVNNLVGTVVGAISGDPAELIEALWTNALVGNNPSASIANVAATSALLQAAGYVSSSVGSVIRSSELWEVLQLIAKESRVFFYMINGVIQLQFMELRANVAAPALTIFRNMIMPNPGIRSSDVEQQVKNRFEAEFDLTDAEGYRQEIQREDAASIAAYGEQLEEVQFLFIKTLSEVESTLAIYLDRVGNPWDQVSFSLTQDHRVLLDPLSVAKLDFGWVLITKFEVLEVQERWDHTLEITGRSL